MMVKRSICAVVAAMAVVLSLMAGAPAQAGKYTPRSGPTFNSATGNGAAQRSIVDKIVKTIRSTPRGAHIQIMTWNYASPTATDALLRAQKRGVKVNVLMAKGNLTRVDNPTFKRLRAGLDRGNRGRDKARRSWARTCVQSCRGRGGAAHAKFYLFSQSGRARNVLIQGSANLTTAASSNQWNDVRTTSGSNSGYGFARGVFAQMAKDKPARRPYTSWRGGPDRLAFFPIAGRGSADPVAGLLNRVRCRGAANTASGRTRILVAPDAMREDRGMALGRKLRRLWVDGCDVRIGYTVMGIDVGRMLRKPSRRGPVPLVHLVRDGNGDGQFDDYFHMKAMTIKGNMGGNRRSTVTLNGSANFSTSAARSDENIGISSRQGLTLRYEEHLTYWFNQFRGGSNRYVYGRQANADGRLVDGFLFGTAPVDGVDPYALVELD
ncbi:phospholipase D-like domain-containing protein [Nocardioides aquaticus]